MELYNKNGVLKKDFETQLQLLTDQARLIDQKLSLKIDHEISNQFEQHQQRVKKTENLYKKLYHRRIALPVYSTSNRKLS
ncbi:hypothetical protein GMD78_02640 [Ornithinibacillus sp. L9]|uniref:Uncharacterized protein n=1 Tax=Ornithinibacillus caprae TaxID=2678566 RepID=A0A6N8FCM4_9BACI|nr:hypothetical protein [Ornithinibacillus caprae]MUK87300.1 hypothetical protein [Ornithinibacillus caprae]